MAAVGAVIPMMLATAGMMIGSQMLMGKPKMPKALPQPTRNEAAEAAMKNDQLSRRRGAAANLLTGPLGQESGSGKPAALGQ